MLHMISICDGLKDHIPNFVNTDIRLMFINRVKPITCETAPVNVTTPASSRRKNTQIKSCQNLRKSQERFCTASHGANGTWRSHLSTQLWRNCCFCSTEWFFVCRTQCYLSALKLVHIRFLSALRRSLCHGN